MAVQANVELPNGLIAEDAYIVIEHISYIKRRIVAGEDLANDLSATAYCYPDASVKNDPTARFHRVDILRPINHDEPFMEQLYDTLKQRPEISNAQDV